MIFPLGVISQIIIMNKYIVNQEEAEKKFSSIPTENINNPERVNNLMSPSYVGCDTEKMELTIEYPVLSWELNRKGALHGGIVCTMMDHSVGLTVAILTGAWAPMASFNVSFLRMGQLDDVLVCKTKIEKLGKRIVFVSGVLYSKSNGSEIATCQATYLNNAE